MQTDMVVMKQAKAANLASAKKYYYNNKADVLKRKLLARISKGAVPQLAKLRQYDIGVEDVNRLRAAAGLKAISGDYPMRANKDYGNLKGYVPAPLPRRIGRAALPKAADGPEPPLPPAAGVVSRERPVITAAQLRLVIQNLGNVQRYQNNMVSPKIRHMLRRQPRPTSGCSMM